MLKGVTMESAATVKTGILALVRRNPANCKPKQG